LWIFDVDMTWAMEAGYFFPASDGCNASPATDCEVDASVWALIFNKDLFDMWRVFDFTSVSWRAVFNSLPTVMALSAFSLIHVPINIPAFAISIDAGRLRI
jgi:SulP family sulfate permease